MGCEPVFIDGRPCDWSGWWTIPSSTETGFGRLEDLVGLAQLLDLAAQPRQLVTLDARQAVLTAAGIAFGLAHPAAQRFFVDTEIQRDLHDRALGLKHEPDGPLA
jgi:hypothetical protein